MSHLIYRSNSWEH